MSKAIKIWLIVAGALVMAGALMFVSVMSTMEWNFMRLSTEKYETNKHEISENFENISIQTDTSDIVFLLSSDEKCRVECYESKKEKHSVDVIDGVLHITSVNEKQWYDYVHIGFGSGPKLKIYLPKSEYEELYVKASTGDVELSEGLAFKSIDISLSTGDVKCNASAKNELKIKVASGDVLVENISAGSIDLRTSTGDIKATNTDCDGDVTIAVSTGDFILSNVECKNLISTGTTGDAVLSNVIAIEKIDIKRGTGDISFDSCDAAEIVVNTTTGDVKGSLLSDKVFITDTDTGRVDVPETITGGKCKITTDTGDIKISIRAGE